MLAANLLAAALAAPILAAVPDRVWVTPDFFIEEGASSPNLERPAAPGGCRESIAAKVCLVAGEGISDCLPGAEPYSRALERLHDEYPPALQGVFCKLKSVYIHPTLRSSAYGGLGDGGGVIGVRQSLIDEGLSLSRWASWKEQLPFGGPKDSYDLRPELPAVEARVPGSSNDMLYFLFTHEFGHILDFLNNLNGGGWRAISWLGWDRSRFDESEFPLRPRVDFYGPGPRLDKSDAPAVYAELLRTDFASLYAATSPYDDFAEALALYVLSRRGGSFAVREPSAAGPALDLAGRMASERLREKREFIESFLSRAEPAMGLKGFRAQGPSRGFRNLLDSVESLSASPR